jgi:hypothetical protein
MAQADQQRRNDLDGRGNLSRERLKELCEWFLAVALDQIQFMSRQFNLPNISEGLVKHYVPRRNLGDGAAKMLQEIATLGSLDRGSVRVILNTSSRTATSLISKLLADGIVASDTPKGALRLHFHPDAAEILFPALFGIEALTDFADGSAPR